MQAYSDSSSRNNVEHLVPYTINYAQRLSKIHSIRKQKEEKNNNDILTSRARGETFQVQHADQTRSHSRERTFGLVRPLSTGRDHSNNRLRLSSNSSITQASSIDTKDKLNQSKNQRILKSFEKEIQEQRDLTAIEKQNAALLQIKKESYINYLKNKGNQPWMPSGDGPKHESSLHTSINKSAVKQAMIHKAWLRSPWPGLVKSNNNSPQRSSNISNNRSTTSSLNSMSGRKRSNSTGSSSINPNRYHFNVLATDSSYQSNQQTRNNVNPLPLPPPLTSSNELSFKSSSSAALQVDTKYLAITVRIIDVLKNNNISYGVFIVPKQCTRNEFIANVEKQFNVSNQISDISITYRSGYSHKVTVKSLSMSTIGDVPDINEYSTITVYLNGNTIFDSKGNVITSKNNSNNNNNSIHNSMYNNRIEDDMDMCRNDFSNNNDDNVWNNNNSYHPSPSSLKSSSLHSISKYQVLNPTASATTLHQYNSNINNDNMINNKSNTSNNNMYKNKLLSETDQLHPLYPPPLDNEGIIDLNESIVSAYSRIHPDQRMHSFSLPTNKPLISNTNTHTPASLLTANQIKANLDEYMHGHLIDKNPSEVNITTEHGISLQRSTSFGENKYSSDILYIQNDDQQELYQPYNREDMIPSLSIDSNILDVFDDYIVDFNNIVAEEEKNELSQHQQHHHHYHDNHNITNDNSTNDNKDVYVQKDINEKEHYYSDEEIRLEKEINSLTMKQQLSIITSTVNRYDHADIIENNIQMDKQSRSNTIDPLDSPFRINLKDPLDSPPKSNSKEMLYLSHNESKVAIKDLLLNDNSAILNRYISVPVLPVVTQIQDKLSPNKDSFTKHRQFILESKRKSEENNRIISELDQKLILLNNRKHPTNTSTTSAISLKGDDLKNDFEDKDGYIDYNDTNSDDDQVNCEPTPTLYHHQYHRDLMQSSDTYNELHPSILGQTQTSYNNNERFGLGIDEKKYQINLYDTNTFTPSVSVHDDYEDNDSKSQCYSDSAIFDQSDEISNYSNTRRSLPSFGTSPLRLRSTDKKYIKEQRIKNIKHKTKGLTNSMTSNDIFLRTTKSSRERQSYISNTNPIPNSEIQYGIPKLATKNSYHIDTTNSTSIDNSATITSSHSIGLKYSNGTFVRINEAEKRKQEYIASKIPQPSVNQYNKPILATNDYFTKNNVVSKHRLSHRGNKTNAVSSENNDVSSKRNTKNEKRFHLDSKDYLTYENVYTDSIIENSNIHDNNLEQNNNVNTNHLSINIEEQKDYYQPSTSTSSNIYQSIDDHISHTYKALNTNTYNNTKTSGITTSSSSSLLQQQSSNLNLLLNKNNFFHPDYQSNSNKPNTNTTTNNILNNNNNNNYNSKDNIINTNIASPTITTSKSSRQVHINLDELLSSLN